MNYILELYSISLHLISYGKEHFSVLYVSVDFTGD